MRFVPFSLLIGGAGGYLSFSDFLAPILGILLGPYLGGLSVLIGNFGAIGLGRPMSFMGLDFLPDFVAAVSVGFLMQRKWWPVVAINVALLAIFFIDPLTSFFVTIPGTSITIPFAWMHIAAFIALLSPLGRKAAKWVETANKPKLIALGLGVLTFISTMMQHLTGNILFEVVFGQINPPIIPLAAWPAEWTAVMFAYPIERTILIVSAVLVGTPIILAVIRTRLIKIGKQEDHMVATSK